MNHNVTTQANFLHSLYSIKALKLARDLRRSLLLGDLKKEDDKKKIKNFGGNKYEKTI